MKYVFLISVMMHRVAMCAQVPVNDTCEGAIELFCGDTITVEIAGAGNEGSGQPSVWYFIEGTGELISVSNCESSNTNSFGVVSTTESGCNNLDDIIIDFTPCPDYPYGSRSFLSTAGVAYYVKVLSADADDLVEDIIISVNCEPAVMGCEVTSACNYNPAANWGDGSCDFVSCGGCGADSNMIEVHTLFVTCNFDANGNIPIDYSYIILNEQDSIVLDIPPHELCVCFGIDSLCIGLQMIENDNISKFYVSHLHCLPVGCYTIVFNGYAQEQWNWSVQAGENITVAAGFLPGEEDFCVNYFTSCPDPEAINYYPNANTMDESICYYAPDFNGDSNIDILDLLDFMTNFGCIEDCPDYDLNGDGFVNLFDLLEFWLLYGG